MAKPNKTKERTPEEVAQEFTGAPGLSSVAPEQLYEVVDDEPEPDLAKEAGLTTVGEVDPDRHSAEPIDNTVAAPEPTGAPVPAVSLLGPDATMQDRMMAMMLDQMAMNTRVMQQLVQGMNASAHAAKEALDQAARQTQPDNKFAPLLSDFNPQGDLQHPRPTLKCEMFIPWEAEQESLTFEEIELLNLLEQGEYQVKRNDGSKTLVTVRILTNLNGKPSRLLMNSETAFNDDNAWLMPPLTTLLRAILATRPHTRKAAEQILTMDQRVAMVEAGELPVSVGVR